MAISDLTGTTWELNDTLPVDMYDLRINATYAIDFYSYLNSSNPNYLFSTFVLEFDSDYYTWELSYQNGSQAYAVAIATGAWNLPQCKTIEIVGGQDAKNAELISFLQDNATLTAVAPVRVEYNSSVIAAMSEDGTKVLQTANKICADDITITFTAPSGSSVETALFSVAGEKWYTDANMTVQHTSSTIDLTAPKGTIVFCKPPKFPEPGIVDYGVTTLTTGSGYAVYEVTG